MILQTKKSKLCFRLIVALDIFLPQYVFMNERKYLVSYWSFYTRKKDWREKFTT